MPGSHHVQLQLSPSAPPFVKNSLKKARFFESLARISGWSVIDFPLADVFPDSPFSVHFARITCRKPLCHISYQCQFTSPVAKTGSSQIYGFYKLRRCAEKELV